MQVLSFLTAALSVLSTASAVAIPLRLSGTPSETWHVTKFDVGCSPGGCAYKFDIYGVATENTPGFNTTCSGITAKKGYVECKDKKISADVNDIGYPKWNVNVEHRWCKGVCVDGGVWGDQQFFAYAHSNITSGTKRFKMLVTEMYGVA